VVGTCEGKKGGLCVEGRSWSGGSGEWRLLVFFCKGRGRRPERRRKGLRFLGFLCGLGFLPLSYFFFTPCLPNFFSAPCFNIFHCIYK